MIQWILPASLLFIWEEQNSFKWLWLQQFLVGFLWLKKQLEQKQFQIERDSNTIEILGNIMKFNIKEFLNTCNHWINSSNTHTHDIGQCVSGMGSGPSAWWTQVARPHSIWGKLGKCVCVCVVDYSMNRVLCKSSIIFSSSLCSTKPTVIPLYCVTWPNLAHLPKIFGSS